MSTFDSTKRLLPEIFAEIVKAKIQLPDFQRGWVWDDQHIRSLLVSIARSFPVGAVMLLDEVIVLGHLEVGVNQLLRGKLSAL